MRNRYSAGTISCFLQCWKTNSTLPRKIEMQKQIYTRFSQHNRKRTKTVAHNPTVIVPQPSPNRPAVPHPSVLQQFAFVSAAAVVSTQPFRLFSHTETTRNHNSCLCWALFESFSFKLPLIYINGSLKPWNNPNELTRRGSGSTSSVVFPVFQKKNDKKLRPF